MKKKRKATKIELIKKAREAILAATQIYNNPNITFKTETFIVLAIIGWTYLLHAYYHSKKIDYKYFNKKNKRKEYITTKYGAYKCWDLEKCLDEKFCPLDKESILNLKFIVGIRHEIEHQMTNKIDKFLSAKLQSCAINFNFYICNLFGKQYKLDDELALNIQFSQIDIKREKGSFTDTYIATNVKNFIVDFENNLTESELKSTCYAYRLLLTPINASRKGQADQVIEFIKSDSPSAKGIKNLCTLIKETERKKYLPNEIVTEVKKQGFNLFTIHKHTILWKEQNARDCSKNFGVNISKTWYWYENWLNFVLKYCENHKERFMV